MLQPLDNYENVTKFFKIVCGDGFNISERNISLSTCGIVENIMKLADDGFKITLTISLHSPTDEQRKEFADIYKEKTFALTLPIELEVLIQNVYVSPYASGWVKDVVEEELKSCHLEKSVMTSKMNDDALFFPSRKQLKELLSQIKEDTKRPLAVE